MKEFAFSSEDSLAIKVIRYEDSGMKGLLIRMVNRRLTVIGRNILTIYNAQSFDRHRGVYLDVRDFKPFVLVSNGPIFASCSGEGTWLVRKPSDGQHLLAGNDNQHELKWPDTDNSTLRKWKVSIDLDAFDVPTGPHDSPLQLKSLHTEVTFIWNADNNEFFIEDTP